MVNGSRVVSSILIYYGICAHSIMLQTSVTVSSIIIIYYYYDFYGAFRNPPRPFIPSRRRSQPEHRRTVARFSGGPHY